MSNATLNMQPGAPAPAYPHDAAAASALLFPSLPTPTPRPAPPAAVETPPMDAFTRSFSRLLSPTPVSGGGDTATAAAAAAFAASSHRCPTRSPTAAAEPSPFAFAFLPHAGPDPLPHPHPAPVQRRSSPLMFGDPRVLECCGARTDGRPCRRHSAAAYPDKMPDNASNLPEFRGAPAEEDDAAMLSGDENRLFPLPHPQAVAAAGAAGASVFYVPATRDVLQPSPPPPVQLDRQLSGDAVPPVVKAAAAAAAPFTVAFAPFGPAAAGAAGTALFGSSPTLSAASQRLIVSPVFRPVDEADDAADGAGAEEEEAEDEDFGDALEEEEDDEEDDDEEDDDEDDEEMGDADMNGGNTARGPQTVAAPPCDRHQHQQHRQAATAASAPAAIPYSKPRPCFVCDQMLSGAWSLGRHVLKKHLGIHPFKVRCPPDPKCKNRTGEFGELGTALRHLRDIHGITSDEEIAAVLTDDGMHAGTKELVERAVKGDEDARAQVRAAVARYDAEPGHSAYSPSRRPPAHSASARRPARKNRGRNPRFGGGSDDDFDYEP